MKQLIPYALLFAGLTTATGSLASQETEGACVTALLRAFDGPSDISACPLLSLEDGRVAGVASDVGVFFVRADGDSNSVYYRLDPRSKALTIMRSGQDPWQHPLRGALAGPDAKFFYYPFFLQAKAGKTHPPGLRRICIEPAAFSLGDDGQSDLKRCRD